MRESIIILGSTGSIGVNTLDVIGRHKDRYAVRGLTAKRSIDRMLEQCLSWQPERVAMVDADAASVLGKELQSRGIKTAVLNGEGAAEELAQSDNATVVCAIVGAAGLPSTLASVRAGNKTLIANKEPLVMLGALIMEEAEKSGAAILPLDSEHNAIFQCLSGAFAGGRPLQGARGIRRLLLTGSGGPFREFPIEQLAGVTPEQACKHPNWNMGRKISVDSATMMNKGLELIEACVLFGVSPDDVEIVVHPQSIVHSMVEFMDGSVIAQMGNPDMRIPIANALAWPERIESGAESLDFRKTSTLNFQPPDAVRFPAIRLAYKAAHAGGTMPAIMNAANEVAVDAFLRGDIGFREIIAIVERAMNQIEFGPSAGLEEVLRCDYSTRKLTRKLISQGGAQLPAKSD